MQGAEDGAAADHAHNYGQSGLHRNRLISTQGPSASIKPPPSTDVTAPLVSPGHRKLGCAPLTQCSDRRARGFLLCSVQLCADMHLQPKRVRGFTKTNCSKYRGPTRVKLYSIGDDERMG